MLTEGFEQYFKLGKNFLNPWSDAGKTLTDFLRRTNQGTLEIAGDTLSRTAEQLKRFSTAKRPEEILNLQKECLNENVTALMSDYQKLINLSLGSFEEMNKTFTSTVKDQQHAAQAAAASATRAAEKEKHR